jgi:hypothetical protein
VLDDLLRVVSLLGTMLAIYALPVSFLFGVLLAIGRMAGDVEIIAMRACGIGIRGLLAPIALLGARSRSRRSRCARGRARRAPRDGGRVRTMLVRGASVERAASTRSATARSTSTSARAATGCAAS